MIILNWKRPNPEFELEQVLLLIFYSFTQFLWQTHASSKNPNTTLWRQLKARYSEPGFFTTLSSLHSHLFRTLALALFVFSVVIFFSPNAHADQVTLAWDASSGAVGYRLFSRQDGQSYDYSSPDWEGSETTCAIELATDATYFLVVRAYNAYGESGNSSEASITIGNPPASALPDYIQIEGPVNVSENTTADYNCRAYYTDGTNLLVEPDNWDVDCAYASISTTGLLTTYDVYSDQMCLIEASYTEGITQNASHSITISDADVPDQQTISVIGVGANWRYFKGYSHPGTGWNDVQFFEDSAWLEGPTGIGYGDRDDATILSDMRYNYRTVYARKAFQLADPTWVTNMNLVMDYDDGFIAYINGEEVARAGISGIPHYDTTASSHEAGSPVTFDLSEHIGLLQWGTNVLAIEIHNRSISSSDLTMIPELVVSHADSNRNNPPPDDDVDTDIVTNLTVSSGEIYEVVSEGLQEGALVYTDRTYTFTDVPDYLVGATYIKTANDDKASNGKDFLSFGVTQNVTIYVAHDDAIGDIPPWLLDFTDTGDQLVTPDTTLSIYTKDFPAGTIVLGGNEGGIYSMYVVIIMSDY